MPRMIDLIRASAVPASLVQSAAKGALSLPQRELVEILVFLANGSYDAREQARQTLNSWGAEKIRAILADPRTPKEVLDYFAVPGNLPSDLMTEMLEGT